MGWQLSFVEFELTLIDLVERLRLILLLFIWQIGIVFIKVASLIRVNYVGASRSFEFEIRISVSWREVARLVVPESQLQEGCLGCSIHRKL